MADSSRDPDAPDDGGGEEDGGGTEKQVRRTKKAKAKKGEDAEVAVALASNAVFEMEI